MTASFSLYAKNVRLPDHATELAAMAADRLVIAAGGDGTLNEALNGLPQGPHNYCTLLIRLEAAHSAVEAAVEVRRRLRLNEGVITLPTYVGRRKGAGDRLGATMITVGANLAYLLKSAIVLALCSLWVVALLDIQSQMRRGVSSHKILVFIALGISVLAVYLIVAADTFIIDSRNEPLSPWSDWGVRLGS